MIDDQRRSGKQDPLILDAANNALAVASLQLAEATSAFRYVLQCAQSHGLSVADCCHATGLDEAFIRRTLAEVA